MATRNIHKIRTRKGGKHTMMYAGKHFEGEGKHRRGTIGKLKRKHHTVR